MSWISRVSMLTAMVGLIVIVVYNLSTLYQRLQMEQNVKPIKFRDGLPRRISQYHKKGNANDRFVNEVTREHKRGSQRGHGRGQVQKKGQDIGGKIKERDTKIVKKGNSSIRESKIKQNIPQYTTYPPRYTPRRLVARQKEKVKEMRVDFNRTSSHLPVKDSKLNTVIPKSTVKENNPQYTTYPPRYTPRRLVEGQKEKIKEKKLSHNRTSAHLPVKDSKLDTVIPKRTVKTKYKTYSPGYTPRRMVEGQKEKVKERKLNPNRTLSDQVVKSSQLRVERPSPSPVLYSEHKGVSAKLLLWHMIPRYRKHGQDKLATCGEYKCVLSSNTSSHMAEADVVIIDAFLLSRNRVKEKPVRTSPNQIWVFFTREPWINYGVRFPKTNWDGIFNWTLTYQRNSDIHMPYGELFLRPDQKVKHDWKSILKRKTQSVLWLVSNCFASSKRMEYVQELRKYVDVDIVGKCGTHKTCSSKTLKKDNVDACFEKSRFYLAFESTFCQDYVTEKFFRTFDHHIVPVVRGKANYSSICPSDLFINTADYESPKELAGYLKYLAQNSTAYLGYLQRRAKYRVGGHWAKICELCSHAHQLDKHRNWYPSITSWIDQCEIPKQTHLH